MLRKGHFYFLFFPAAYASNSARIRAVWRDNDLEEAMNQNTPTLPETGFLRLNQVLQFIPYKKTAWYAGLKAGRFPKPIPLGPRARGYRCEDIAALIQRLFPLRLSGTRRDTARRKSVFPFPGNGI